MQRCLTDIPNNRELGQFHDMLQWIIDWHEVNAPHASRVIDAAMVLGQEIPYDSEDLTAE